MSPNREDPEVIIMRLKAAQVKIPQIRNHLIRKADEATSPKRGGISYPDYADKLREAASNL